MSTNETSLAVSLLPEWAKQMEAWGKFRDGSEEGHKTVKTCEAIAAKYQRMAAALETIASETCMNDADAVERKKQIAREALAFDPLSQNLT